MNEWMLLHEGNGLNGGYFQIQPLPSRGLIYSIYNTHAHGKNPNISNHVRCQLIHMLRVFKQKDNEAYACTYIKQRENWEEEEELNVTKCINKNAHDVSSY